MWSTNQRPQKKNGRSDLLPTFAERRKKKNIPKEETFFASHEHSLETGPSGLVFRSVGLSQSCFNAAVLRFVPMCYIVLDFFVAADFLVSLPPPSNCILLGGQVFTRVQLIGIDISISTNSTVVKLLH